MPERAPSPPDRYNELHDAACDLRCYAAIADLVLNSLEREIVTAPLSTEGCITLILTRVQTAALERVHADLGLAAQKLDEVMRSHDV